MAIELKKEDIKTILPSIQKYLLEEFDIEAGEMRARFLLDFFLVEIAPFAYNKGVSDAERYFLEKTQDLTGAIFEPELTYWKHKKK